MKKHLIILFPALFALTMWGCYTSTIDALSTFKFQLPINFYSNWINKAAPDTSWDFNNLLKYDEYKDNQDKIKKSEILSFNYWIDSLIFDNGEVFKPGVHQLEFEFIKFYLVFARLKANPPNPFNPLDESNYEFDPDSPEYLLGEFTNVNATAYYRSPEHILEVPEDVAEVIAVAVKEKPQFFIKSIYSKTKGQTEPKRYFNLINARFDMVIRFEVSL